MLIAIFAALALQTEVPPPAAAASAETVRRYATSARQGVAVGPRDIYAVSNWELTRYDKATGEQRAQWVGDRNRFPHINSCAVIAAELVCASSNFPAVPHVSTVEVFDPQTLAHRRSIALGLGTGSITWIDRKDGFWWAMFANYDGKGGEPPRDHRHTTLVKYDAQWRKLESWALPASVLQRIAPMSISGGGWGPDGRLYLSGHDLPELYVMALPAGGGVLDHLGALAMEAEGQAVDWDEAAPGMLYGITRRTREVLAMEVPIARK
jgi:hypothetical protein